MININSYQHIFTLDEPVSYRLKCEVDLQLFPVKFNMYELFKNCLESIMIDKNSVPDINILKMNYLEFLYNVQFNIKDREKNSKFTIGELTQYKFEHLLNICCEADYSRIVKENGKCYCVLAHKIGEDYVTFATINATEFNDIKEIILYQNILDYSKIEMSDDVKKIYNDYIKLITQDIHEPTLEQKKNYVIAHTGFSSDFINNMTYRRFIGIYDCIINEALYFSNRMAEVSEKYDVKKNAPFFMYKKKDILNGFLLSEEKADKIKQMVE